LKIFQENLVLLLEISIPFLLIAGFLISKAYYFVVLLPFGSKPDKTAKKVNGKPYPC